jgi:ferric enterobactin receptor
MRKFSKWLLIICFLFSCLASFSQQSTISGTVVSDKDNSPLPDVTVLNRQSKRSTVTDASGRFTIEASKGETLVFTYVGFLPKDLLIQNTGATTVRLTQDASQLGNVTVTTAYGVRRSKKSLGYSTQVVDGDEVAQTRRENFVNGLAGRIAGATITSSSGAPGSSSQIILRGATSIGGNNQPLFVVDGVPYDNQTLNQENLIGSSATNSITFANRNSDYGNRAMDLNPEDIESYTVLKGPEATALYGSDGASGAIVITTRKGKTGNTTLSYDNSFKVEEVYKFAKTQNVYTIGSNGVYDPNATVNPFSILGTTTGAGVPGAFGPKITDGRPLYNNVDNFFKTGFTQQHNVNLEGGSDIATYRFSGNFLNQDGIVPNTGYEKVSIRLTGSTRFKKLRITSTINYINSITDKATKGAGGYLLNLLTWPVENNMSRYINPDGTKVPIRNISNYSLEYDNPLWDVNKNPSQDKLDRATGNLNLGLDVTKWLNVGAILGVDYFGQTGFLATHPLSRNGFNANGYFSLYEQTTRNFSNTLRVTANKTFGSFSNSLTAGFYFEDNNTRIESQRGERFFERDYLSINNTDPLSRDAKTAITNTRKNRFFANLVTGYKEIVFLSLAATREGNSTFMSKVVTKDPFYDYGSASLSFVLSDLPGIKNNVSWLNLAKLRASYASTGKGPYAAYVIDYRFAPQITTGGGYAYDVTGNNFGLDPERSKNLELGIEFNAFKNRFRLDANYYSLRSEKQLLAARASYGTGFVIKWFNGGAVQNQGVEVQLGLTPVKSRNFNWDMTVNFDKNVGKVLSMPADLPTFYDSDTWVFGNLRSQFFKGVKTGNLAATTFRKNNAGRILINPTTGLPVKDVVNFVTVGDRQPDFKVAVINNFTYKNFTLSFNLDFRKGGDVFNATEYFLYLTGYSTKTMNRETPVVISGVLQDGLENSGKPTENTIAITPFNNSTFYSSTTATSEEDFLENVNWMRLRDLTLSYRFGQKLISRQKFIKSASVFFTGTDLFMITNYTGADPSVNANNAGNRGFGGAGIDFGSISTPRALNLGCRIQL